MRTLHGTNWGTLRRAASPEAQTPLFQELCRLFHAKDRAMLCLVSHGRVSIDGYIIRNQHLDRWTPEQLRGRYAKLFGQQAQLYGTKVVER